MKAIKMVTLIALVFLFKGHKAQSTIPINYVHETIGDLKVSYRPAPQSNVTSTMPDINVIAQATINLINSTNVSKIYFKILDEVNGGIIYGVNYNINSSIVINNSNEKLFENNNGVLFISSGLPMTLKMYNYQIQTADSNNNLSTIYSTFQ